MATATLSPVDSDVTIIHSIYTDNPYLDQAYKSTLEKLINQDINFYNIYVLGTWGLLQRRIFTNYKIIPALPEMPKAHWAYGLDYGLVNPSAILKAYLFEDSLYFEERLYKSGLTTADIISFFSHEDKGDIYADPTAKMMNEEVRRAGYSIFDGIKGVKESIDLCRRHTLYIPQTSVNLTREISSYQWKTDKEGNVLQEPVKFNDHLIDCMRYVVWGLVSRYGFPTQRPQVTKPIRAFLFRRRR